MRVVSAMVAAGAAAGALWAWLAPPAQVIVALTRSGDRVRAYLGNDSDQLFLGAFLLVGFVGVIAVVGAVAAWQWRVHRGPVLVAAVAAGAAAAAGAADVSAPAPRRRGRRSTPARPGRAGQIAS